jgi:hypothetical protein
MIDGRRLLYWYGMAWLRVAGAGRSRCRTEGASILRTDRPIGDLAVVVG